MKRSSGLLVMLTGPQAQVTVDWNSVLSSVCDSASYTIIIIDRRMHSFGLIMLLATINGYHATRYYQREGWVYVAAGGELE